MTNFKQKVKNLKKWLQVNCPRITTKKRIDEECIYNMAILERVNARHKFAMLNPVIYDLEKLRADTWNQNKITHMQEWLRQYIKEGEEIFIR